LGKWVLFVRKKGGVVDSGGYKQKKKECGEEKVLRILKLVRASSGHPRLVSQALLRRKGKKIKS